MKNTVMNDQELGMVSGGLRMDALAIPMDGMAFPVDAYVWPASVNEPTSCFDSSVQEKKAFFII